MLVELRVRDLGVIEDLSLVFEPGLTAVTGETGAGKTLVVEALALLAGARADSASVRAGADEAVVEARFEVAGEETVVRRVVHASGRSRASVDGAMVTVAALGERIAAVLELHAQHGQQQLQAPAAQRRLLDAYAGTDLVPLRQAREQLREVDGRLRELGGDARARAREIDLLRHQLAEIEAAALGDLDEDAALEREEDLLANAAALRDAALGAHAAIAEEGGGADGVRTAMAPLAGRDALADLHARLAALTAELDDAAGELRRFAETLEDDPDRLAAVRARRQLLRDLCRKYGSDLAEVKRYAADTAARLADLEAHDDQMAALEAERTRWEEAARAAAAKVAKARRGAAPTLSAAVTHEARALALPDAVFQVEVGGEDPGDDVAFLFSANRGEPPAPLARVASGGELARVMLALRLAASATDAPDTMVFDEVDAGVGGEAALAVGRALAALAPRHQVLVVTHLAQVAAFADHQIAVRKRVSDDRTVAAAQPVDGVERVVELSRMLSGQPDSDAARSHAEELLVAAAEQRRAAAR